ncbi:Polyketide cyclase / dehydrase and lipid transport [Parafrankia irregularis]|uniref:Polyketide cyclase / dehydrase and lipid transport n=1 Tax=Parafrankia irregularis TaxID=795642 RepID=A0A0S4QW94_9ACTN|nr:MULTISPECIES: SRPBCC family protein [Parafrankia]MBE3201583.1 SRPBCC family protein [Parafrankia sp. CH37]CUU59342.1 Polyketide cyclase / dehydrase and lipid transport [Parafrankia irregularis]
MTDVREPEAPESGAVRAGTQDFLASATVTVGANMHDIWAVWVDVNAWKSWDTGIESTKLHGNFKAGNTFTLTPAGGQPMEVTITSVTQGEEFSDETVLPFGTIRTSHRMEPLGGLVRLTHEVRAEIAEDAVEMFGVKIWPHLQSGLSTALNELAEIVAN